MKGPGGNKSRTDRHGANTGRIPTGETEAGGRKLEGAKPWGKKAKGGGVRESEGPQADTKQEQAETLVTMRQEPEGPPKEAKKELEGPSEKRVGAAAGNWKATASRSAGDQ